MKKLLLLKFICITCLSLFSQKNNNNLFYTSFDNTIGQNNTPLSYGVIYKEKYIKRIKGNHNFFLNNQFNEGSVYFRGEPFFNILLKYDIVNDLVVLKISNDNQFPPIIPDKNLIKNFQIDKFKFINTPLGFLEEVVLSKKFSIYKKHIKISKENINGVYKNYTFESKAPKFILAYKGKYYSIKSKRDFIKVFPHQKKNIARHFRLNKPLLKHNFKEFTKKLMNSLTTNILDNDNFF